MPGKQQIYQSIIPIPIHTYTKNSYIQVEFLRKEQRFFFFLNTVSDPNPPQKLIPTGLLPISNTRLYNIFSNCSVKNLVINLTFRCISDVIGPDEAFQPRQVTYQQNPNYCSILISNFHRRQI